MLVRDYMTEKVFTIRADKKLLAAKQIMEWAHVRHVPVVDLEGHVVGLVSHRDLLNASLSSITPGVVDAERSQHLGTISIEKIMHKGARKISPNAPIQEAAKIMRSEKIGCLIVVAQDKLVGIITEYDLLRIVEGLGTHAAA